MTDQTPDNAPTEQAQFTAHIEMVAHPTGANGQVNIPTWFFSWPDGAETCWQGRDTSWMACSCSEQARDGVCQHTRKLARTVAAAELV